SIALISPAAAQPEASKAFAGTEQDIAALADRYQAPGVAVAVILDGEIVKTVYHGQSDLETQERVSAKTQFGIGSVVKSFTSGLIGLLEEQGSVSLDAHPTQYLKDLPQMEVMGGADMQVRHLLSHTSGMPFVDGTMAFFPLQTRSELMKRLSVFERSCIPGRCWNYNNLNFMMLDAIAAAQSQSSKGAMMKELLLEPAGMNDTLSLTADFLASPHAAKGYVMSQGKPDATSVEYLLGEQIYSTAPDMARWIDLWMNGGKAGERQVLAADYVTRAISMQAIDNGAPPASSDPDTYMFGYGFAWNVKSVHGHYVTHHGGNENGFSTHVLFVPAARFGVVAMTNQQDSILPNLVTDTMLRRFAGLPPVPVQDYPLVVGEAPALLPDEERALKLNPDAPLATQPGKLAGLYAAQGYGVIEVRFEDGELTLRPPLGPLILKHKGGQDFGLASSERINAGIQLPFFQVTFGDGTDPDHFTFNIGAEPVVFKRVFEG
ncbi:MAG: serine hydrolase domain-containing protein, partial [Pseudomonadota bacterium]